MNLTMLVLFPLAVVILLAMPLIPAYKKITTGQQAKGAVLCNLCAFFGVAALMLILPATGALSVALAAPEATAAAAQLAGRTAGDGMAYLSAALATGLSCIGSGIAVASAAPAAVGAVSEDPTSFGKAMIFVVLGEGVAIYGMLISILIINTL